MTTFPHSCAACYCRETRDRETLLHALSRSWRQASRDLPGKEWFMTDPKEIADGVRNIIGANALQGNASNLEIEDVIDDAFKDVAADDWTRLPADLTDRVDDYLCGRDRAWSAYSQTPSTESPRLVRIICGTQ